MRKLSARLLFLARIIKLLTFFLFGVKIFNIMTIKNLQDEILKLKRGGDVCILAHSYRQKNPPQSLEAKILFDADKLDVVGAIGIARTLLYKGIVSEPIYSLMPDGSVSTGENDAAPSFFHEYKHKLEKMYSHFYTVRAAGLAKERKQIAVDFYNHLYQESTFSYRHGRKELDRLIQ